VSIDFPAKIANGPARCTGYDTLRRCGNPTCRCADRPTHRQTLLVFTRKGQRRCRFVRQAEVALFREAADRYRAWRRALMEFLTLQNRERAILRVQIQKRAMALE